MEPKLLAKTEPFRSFAALARACGVSREAVRKWKRVPAEHCRAIERASKGKITRQALRPDIFGAVAARKPRKRVS